MGWVTLSLRRMEDQVLHNNLQLELLGISRQRQQLARHRSYESLVINNQRKADIKAAESTSDKKAMSDAVKKAQDEYSEWLNKHKKKSSGTEPTKTDGDNSENTSTTSEDARTELEDSEYEDQKNTHQSKISDAQAAYNEACEKYENYKMNINDMYDQELQSLEEDTTQEENFLDMQQTQIETQLEAITQELQAVKQQVSTDIQNSTISLK